MSGRYKKGLDAFGKGQINWPSDDIRCIAINASLYTVDLTNHEFLSDVPAGARVAVSATLTGKTSSNGGVLSADDFSIPAVTGHVDAEIFYKHTGSDATARLCCYEDCAGGLPRDFAGEAMDVTLDGNPDRRVMKL